MKPAKGYKEYKSEITSARHFLVASGSRRRGPHLYWSGSASDSRESVASKEIEDLDKLKDVKILLSGLPFGFSVLAKARSRRKLQLPL